MGGQSWTKPKKMRNLKSDKVEEADKVDVQQRLEP